MNNCLYFCRIITQFWQHESRDNSYSCAGLNMFEINVNNKVIITYYRSLIFSFFNKSKQLTVDAVQFCLNLVTIMLYLLLFYYNFQ